jgi:hypothetical protein
MILSGSSNIMALSYVDCIKKNRISTKLEFKSEAKNYLDGFQYRELKESSYWKISKEDWTGAFKIIIHLIKFKAK